MVWRKRNRAHVRPHNKVEPDENIFAEKIPDVRPNRELAYSQTESLEPLDALLDKVKATS